MYGYALVVAFLASTMRSISASNSAFTSSLFAPHERQHPVSLAQDSQSLSTAVLPEVISVLQLWHGRVVTRAPASVLVFICSQ